ncbi:MAG: methyltransferase [Pigmentiphaga sp.]|uniref:class I SAM-dependent methyltransferase n=1 Tax=Pigmentiphaga sp. TaxID=1977564 RepID=UPI0029B30FFA|nr:methyltransferase [Pigmentiphaga sp.]MDX3906651.1 methyltransferase [Pigmentiphaga sp.]
MFLKPIIVATGLSLVVAACAIVPRQEDEALRQAVASPARTPAFVARDTYRKPYEVLHFFGIEQDDTVVEISPGGGYWTEILAPYLHDRGTYYAAQYPREGGGRPYYRQYYDNFRAKLDADPGKYGKVQVTAFGKGHYDIAPPGSADLVVTFRNLHNWMRDGYAEAAFAAFYKALKPGGVLGIEAHRGRDDRPQDPQAADGYVRQDYAIRLARQAGFVLEGSSELLANPRDTKDHPAGVWTLPPTYRLGDKDRERYAAIGEADGLLLKFRKP